VAESKSPLIVVSNQLKRLASQLDVAPGPFRYLNFDDDQQSLDIGRYLEETYSAERVDKESLFINRRQAFQQQYIDLLAGINQDHHSLTWWSMPLTDKSPFHPELGRRIAYFLLVVAVAQSAPGTLVILTNDRELAGQIKTWAQAAGIQQEISVRNLKPVRRFLKDNTPGGVIRGLARTLVTWFASKRLRPVKNQDEEHLLITTLTHPWSFHGPDGYRDSYFEPLIQYLADHGQKALMMSLVMEEPHIQRKGYRRMRPRLPLFPLESCLTLWDLSQCTFRALKLHFSRTAVIDGVDVSYLVQRTIWDICHSGNPFMNLRLYYSSKWLAKRCRINRCIYMYENLPWERMLLTGIREVTPDVRFAGCQHAAVTESHTNIMMRESELAYTPMPDVLLTTGETITKWLESVSSHPAGVIKTACALRYGRPAETATPKRRKHVTQILVALSTSVQEYVKTFAFLDRASLGMGDRHFVLRPHPSIPIQDALDATRFSRPEMFSASTRNLEEDLEWADAVLFVSSTVGMEAVSRGVPAVYLDLGDFLDTDGMLKWDVLKWKALEPSKLSLIFDAIEAIPDDEFARRQESGREFVDSYLAPVTEHGIRMFLES
jgi:surface carbohydrate biosynthesis protein (TIGR04326 family)